MVSDRDVSLYEIYCLPSENNKNFKIIMKGN